MDKKTVQVLLLIASIGLTLAGLIFIFIIIFSNDESEWILPGGIFFVILGSLFNRIRILLYKKNTD